MSQSKKRLLRILSPNHRDTTAKLFSKETNPLYTSKNANHGIQALSGTTNIQISSKDSQAGKTSQISANCSEKKLIKMKRVHVTKITNGPRKPGIKQIQMVYLNPSHGSSRRSPSLQSQRSNSKNSEHRNNGGISGNFNSFADPSQQENSIQQAYGSRAPK